MQQEELSFVQEDAVFVQEVVFVSAVLAAVVAVAFDLQHDFVSPLVVAAVAVALLQVEVDLVQEVVLVSSAVEVDFACGH